MSRPVQLQRTQPTDTEPQSVARPFTPSSTGPALVLVVDDQARNLQQVKKILNCDGYQVATAQSGEEALHYLSARSPDLILLDVMMPGMDGFGVCDHIKSIPEHHDIPIIFLSGDTEYQSVVTGFARGGVDYIRKPFNQSELLARVRTHVDLCRSQRDHQKQLQEKQKTLDLIAHEWHKPLQKIALTLAKIRELGGSARSDTASALGIEASSELERMLNSVENFLHHESPDGPSLAASTGSFTTDDLKAMAGKWYVTAKRKLIDLQLHAPTEPVPVSGPPFAINQIVDALLSNAVNFTPKNGVIHVRISKEDSLVRFRVEDGGPGFSSEYLKRKFQPFLRCHPEGSTQRGGVLGVGLAAAKRTADRISAKLDVANKTDGGAVATAEFVRP